MTGNEGAIVLGLQSLRDRYLTSEPVDQRSIAAPNSVQSDREGDGEKAVEARRRYRSWRTEAMVRARRHFFYVSCRRSANGETVSEVDPQGAAASTT